MQEEVPGGASHSADGTDGPRRIRGIINELFGLLVNHGHRVEPETAEIAGEEASNKLTEICLDCQTGFVHEEEPEANAETGAEPAPAAAAKTNEKRKYFLLRLVSCKLSHLFDTVNNPKPLNRQCSHGIDAYMRRIFKPGVYDELNDRTEEILRQLGSGDASILSAIYNNRANAAFMENVLVRICLSLAKYETAKDAFISELNMAQPNDAPELGRDEFKAIVGAMLSDVFLLGRTATGGDRLDYRYGPNTATVIDKVAGQFGKDIPPEN